MDWILRNIVVTLDASSLFIVSEQGTESGRREYDTEPRAGGVNASGEVALGDQFQIYPALPVQPIEMIRIGLSRKGANHLYDAPRIDEGRHPSFAIAGIVVHYHQIRCAGYD